MGKAPDLTVEDLDTFLGLIREGVESRREELRYIEDKELIRDVRGGIAVLLRLDRKLVRIWKEIE